MEYKRLPFNQYYIDTSNDQRNTGKSRFKLNYSHVEFTYKLFKLIPIRCSAEWEIHYEPDRDVIQINFEQTHGIKDWFINFLFPSKMYDKFKWNNVDTNKEEDIQLKACRGWMKMYFAIKHNMLDSVSKLLSGHPDANIEIIGWSLGSSQAQFAAQDIFYNLHKQCYLYTYGSVKPWKGGKRVKSYLKHIYKDCYNFAHKRDVITYMPPFIGYFAIKPVRLGSFNLFSLFNPEKWHTEYGESYIYNDIK